jgi:hypothetical protein
MSQNLSRAIAVIGIDIGKNSFHVVGLDERGAIALQSGQVARSTLLLQQWRSSSLSKISHLHQRRPMGAEPDESALIGLMFNGKPNVIPARSSLTGRPLTDA